MRTIKQSLARRLMAQAEEAKVQGLQKTAKSLNNQLSKTNCREDNESYSYSSDEFYGDVEGKLWDIMIRAADFYGCNVDGAALQNVVEKAASDILSEFRVKSGVKADIGANEPRLPGESDAALSVEEA